jgi:hypothetical protein
MKVMCERSFSIQKIKSKESKAQPMYPAREQKNVLHLLLLTLEQLPSVFVSNSISFTLFPKIKEERA